MQRQLLITGRGSTAIYLALHDIKNREVIVPSNICYAAIFSILYSNNIPRFVDICYPSGNSNLEQIQSAYNSKTGAILYPHMYGNISDEMPAIKQFCQKHQLLLIEDCASAMGGTYANGRPVGSYGDFSIFSTGHSKNVDLGNGGILATFNIPSTLVDSYNSLPIFNDSINENRNKIAHNYSSIKHLGDDRKIKQFLQNFNNYRDSFLYQINDARLISKINNSFSMAAQKRSSVLAKKQLFLDNLPEEICYTFSPNSLPWRFSILISDSNKRQQIILKLLSRKLFVSDWYPCIGRFYDSSSRFPNAIRMEQEILNFQLSNTDENILEICDIIKTSL